MLLCLHPKLNTTAAFLRSFTAHERAHVRRLVPMQADADDVMQEISVVLWEKFDSLLEGVDFRAWGLWRGTL